MTAFDDAANAADALQTAEGNDATAISALQTEVADLTTRLNNLISWAQTNIGYRGT